MNFEEYAKQFKVVEGGFQEEAWTVNVWKKGCTDSVYYKASCWNEEVSEGAVTGIGDTLEEAVLDALEISYDFDHDFQENLMNFKNTYITLKDSDQTVERIKEIAEKYSEASGYELEDYLKGESVMSYHWEIITIAEGVIQVCYKGTFEKFNTDIEITEQDLDSYLAEVGESSKESVEHIKEIAERYSGLPVEAPPKDSIGSLAEKLYTTLPPSNITISVNGNGHILIHGDKIPTVDATKLAAEDITKAYEALVMLEGLFVEGE